ncbi:efflux RND transporter permease subunit [Ignavibacteria bacterium]|nr:efflux RND transporter permease subunit [Bacteroidota bacterium]MCZ2133028.1 efflux RND transporter permease subunit [Bacteroidota bacterium]
MTLTELAIKRPTIVVVLFSVLGVLGIFGYTQLNYELLPKISPPILTISTIYPGASPSEVENSVTKVIEDAVSGLDKVSTIRSTSYEGRSLVMVELQQSAKVDIAAQDANRKVNAAQILLPKDSRAPVISKIALDEIPVIRMGATSSLPSRELYQFVKDKVQPELSKLDGVSQITLIGGDEREIRVNLDLDKIRGYGLSVGHVTDIVKASNIDVPTGNIKTEESEFVVRVAGKIKSVEQLREVIVGRAKSGGDIRLRDVAEVEDGRKEYTTINRINGVTSIGIFVQKQSDANTVEVAKRVHAEIAKLEATNSDIKLKFTVAQDGSLFTIDAAEAVKYDLLLAIILVAAVMFIFLHSIRNSFIVMVAIPASLISTTFVMYLLGFSLNLMTLLGLSLVIGILVDDSIVVLENIYHHLERGKHKRIAALDGRNEIGFAALSITLVDVVVFVPLSLVGGIVGNILREFAVVVFVSTLFSLLVSFTITPVLASRFARLENLSRNTLMARFSRIFERMFHKLTDEYLAVLNWSLRSGWTRAAVVLATLLLLVGALMLPALGFIGQEFMTQTDRGEFAVTVELPQGTSLEKTNQTALQIEQYIRSMPEVDKVLAGVGMSSEGLIGASSPNSAEINVTLVPKDKRVKSTDEIGAAIKAYALAIPGAKARVNPIGIFGTANQTPIQIVLSGSNQQEVQKAAVQLMDITRRVKGAADVRLSVEDNHPETRVEIDRQKIAALGLAIGEVGSALRIVMTGNDDLKYRDGNNEYTLRILGDEFDRSKTEKLKRMAFMNNRGQQIELQQFADVFQSVGPSKLQRENRNSAVTLFSQALGRPSGTIMQDIDKQLKITPLPAGINMSLSGDLKNQKESQSSLVPASMAAIIFVYLIMVALYNSYLHPFTVLFSIPVAIIGAFLAMALNMKAMGLFPSLGMIMLIGLVAKNAILLVDRANYMREQGESIKKSLLDAGKMRLRPILMTTIAMIMGMLPIALSHSSGAEWKAGLAWALVGGLTSSLLLTLVLIPVIYYMFEALKVRIAGYTRRKSGENDNDIAGDMAIQAE